MPTSSAPSAHAGGSTIYDAFVAKFDPNGNLVTVRTFGGPSSGGPHAAAIGVATDSSGNIYIDGFFAGTGINFDAAFGTGSVTLDAAGPSDTFVLKLDPNFNLLWARRIGTSGQDNPDDLAFDTENNTLFVDRHQCAQVKSASARRERGPTSSTIPRARTRASSCNSTPVATFSARAPPRGRRNEPPQPRGERPGRRDRRWRESDRE